MAARATVAALLAFALGRALGLAQGYWAVFTAIIVMQTSLGGSFGAALDYFIGTLAGAVYGVAVALILPLGSLGMLGLALAVTVGPLALLAAIRRNFRVAPITGAILLLIPATQQTGVLGPAIGRVIEIAIGSGVGVLVARFVLPARAHNLVAETAADILRLSARLVAVLFAGFGDKRDLTATVRLQDGYRRLLVKLDSVVADAARERANHFSAEPDAEPLLRTLRRLRFDFVIIGRAAATALPPPIGARLLPALNRVSETVRSFLNELASGLAARRAPPIFDAASKAFADYAAAMAEARRAGLTRDLADAEVARIFTLGFALDELRRNLADMAERVAEFERGK
jgi:uncharacterized membrane protein YccC